MEIFLFIVLGFLIVAGVLVAVWGSRSGGTPRPRSRGRRSSGASGGGITWADGGSGSSCGGGSSSCGGSSSSCGGGGGGCGGGS